MRIRSSQLIKAPVERVFEVFADIANCAGRIKGITKVEVLSETRSGLGLRWRETRVLFGKEATEEMEVTAFDAPKSYVVEARSHGMHYVTTFTFEPGAGAGSTQVSWVFDGKALSLGAKLMTPLMLLFKGATEKMMKQDLLDLKAYLENA